MLLLALLEGYLGYSLVDDLLSGMGLAIGYSVALSIPFVGGTSALLLWGAPFPGAPALRVADVHRPRPALPALIGRCSALHLALVALAPPHAVPRRDARRERRVVGMPAFPGHAPRSLGLLLAVAGVLFLLGGLVQINPIWLWGPYDVGAGDERRAARLVPRLADRRAAARARASTSRSAATRSSRTRSGAARSSRSSCSASSSSGPGSSGASPATARFHNLLDRPRDAPWRTAFGVALLDLGVRSSSSPARPTASPCSFGISYAAQIWVYRVAVRRRTGRGAPRDEARLRRAPRGRARRGARLAAEREQTFRRSPTGHMGRHGSPIVFLIVAVVIGFALTLAVGWIVIAPLVPLVVGALVRPQGGRERPGAGDLVRGTRRPELLGPGGPDDPDAAAR